MVIRYADKCQSKLVSGIPAVCLLFRRDLKRLLSTIVLSLVHRRYPRNPPYTCRNGSLPSSVIVCSRIVGDLIPMRGPLRGSMFRLP